MEVYINMKKIYNIKNEKKYFNKKKLIKNKYNNKETNKQQESLKNWKQNNNKCKKILKKKVQLKRNCKVHIIQMII